MSKTNNSTQILKNAQVRIDADGVVRITEAWGPAAEGWEIVVDPAKFEVDVVEHYYDDATNDVTTETTACNSINDAVEFIAHSDRIEVAR